mgnify:CR=1 FL=1
MWAFSASVGLLLRPRLNGVRMALEGGGAGKVRVPIPECKMGEKWEVGLQVGLQTGVTFSENWGYKTLARAYRERGEEKSKKRSKV